MSTEADGQCIPLSKIKDAVHLAIREVRAQYGNEISNLKAKLDAKQRTIQSLQHSLSQIQAQMEQNKKQWDEQRLNLVAEVRGYQTQALDSSKANKENESIVQQLLRQLQNKEDQLSRVLKQVNCDVFSQSVSSISKKEQSNNKTYSFDLSEYFQNYPETTLKLLNSLPDERTNDEKEVGDMVCMFISRDQLSAEKYVNINRNFLKRKIKAEEKRFRIVIIYKPDKK